MAKKISIRDVATRVNNFISAYDLGFNFSFATPNSSDAFDNRTSMILTEFLPLSIIVACEYYLTGEISNSKKEIFNKIITSEVKRLGASGIDENDMKYFISLSQKILVLNLTSKQFSDRDFILFDSTSKEHKAAFNEPSSKRSSTNFVLKINGTGSEAAHIRIGINVDVNNIHLEIVDIVNKKTGNQ